MTADRPTLRANRVLPHEEGAERVRPGVLTAATPGAEVFELVCRHMRTLVGSRDPDYEDLVQIAAERALRDLESFEGRSALSTWVYRVCYRTLLTHRRWYRRWLRRFALTAAGSLPEIGASDSGTGEHGLYEHRRRARLHAAIATLSEKRRTVLVLHDLEGLAVDQIAQIVQANVLTVRSRLRDARRDLAQCLRHDPFFGDEACLSPGGSDEH